jgi:putative acetyltransferase
MHAVSIQVEPSVSPEVLPLLAQMDAYFAELYPAESIHTLSAEALEQPGVTFLVARINGKVAGCGAMVEQSTYAEFKRVFVQPAFRGMAVGRAVLEELERQATAVGLSTIYVETGVAQPEALRLFERAGYRRRGPFGDYPDDPLSVFLEKRLT